MNFFKPIVVFTGIIWGLNLDAHADNYDDNKPFVNDYSLFVSVPYEKNVVDTVAMTPTFDRLNNEIEKIRINIYGDDGYVTKLAQLEEAQSKITEIYNQSFFEKKINDTETLEFLTSIFTNAEFVDNFVEDGYFLKKYIWENPKEFPKKKDYPKIENILKNVQKKKINDEVRDALRAVFTTITQNKESLSELKNSDLQLMKDAETALQTLKSYDPERHDEYLSRNEREIFDKFSLPYPPACKTITDYKNVENKWRRDINASYSENSFIDKMLQTKGWEWANKYDGYESQSVHYPVTATFKVYESHPEYHVVDNVVFDAEGNLVRILELNNKTIIYDKVTLSDVVRFSNTKIINKAIINDYKNNKYNILNEGADVKYALDNLLGLSDAFKKAEEKRLEPYTKKLKQALLSGNAALYSRLQDQYAHILYGPKPNDPHNNKKATAFIAQCNLDHENLRLKIWKIERVDNVTFKIILLNNGNTVMYTPTITFLQQGAYNSVVESEDFTKLLNGELLEGAPFDATPYLENLESNDE